MKHACPGLGEEGQYWRVDTESISSVPLFSGDWVREDVMSQAISTVFVNPYSVTNGERLTCMDLTDLLSPYSWIILMSAVHVRTSLVGYVMFWRDSVLFACGLAGSVLVHVGLTCASVAFEAGVDKSCTYACRRICNLVCWFALRICILKSTCAVIASLFVYFNCIWLRWIVSWCWLCNFLDYTCGSLVHVFLTWTCGCMSMVYG